MHLGDNVLTHVLDLQGIDSLGPYDLEMLFQIIDILLHVFSKCIVLPVFIPELGKDACAFLRGNVDYAIQARLVKVTGGQEHLMA